MKFLAPGTAPAHIAIRNAAARDGIDTDAFRELMWVINAHPELVSHARVLAHLAAHFQSALTLANLNWASSWQASLPAWTKICRWAWDQRHALANLPELREFDRQPNPHRRAAATGSRRTDDHPLLRRGISRHPLVGALWSSHQSISMYPPPGDGSCPTAEQHFRLQTHVLLAHIEQRYTGTTLQDYESYEREPEYTGSIGSAAAIGVALREFTHARFDALLVQIPTNQPTPIFSRALRSFTPELAGIPLSARDDAKRYLQAIVRYLGAFERVLEGKAASQKKRTRGGHGLGGHAWRPGYVHYPAAPAVQFRPPEPAPEDSDIPFSSATEVLISEAGDKAAEAQREAERSGLAPEDTLEPSFLLFSPDEIGKRLAQRRYQQLALQAAAQHLPFAYTCLTPAELRRINAKLKEAVEALLSTSTSPSSSASYYGRAALLLQVMLYLGQPLETARVLEYGFCSALDERRLPKVSAPRLLFLGAQSDWASATPVGFLLPSVTPDYMTRLEPSLDGMNRPLAESLFLPDSFGLGEQLLGWLRKANRPDDKVFGMEPKTARNHAKSLLDELGDRRLTLEKLALVLPTILINKTADPSVAWCATGAVWHRNEPRMYYTRHATRRLRQAYLMAAGRLARDLGGRIQTPPILPTETDPAPSIGARFVPRLDVVRDLVTSLRQALQPDSRVLVSVDDFLDYHHNFVLYTWLVQSLSTTLRAVRRVNQLYHAWESSTGASSVIAGLSDKESMFFDRARLVTIDGTLAKQFLHYKQHIDFLAQRIGMYPAWRTQDGDDRPLVIVSGSQFEAVTPTWIESQLVERRAPLPANFHRGFLRTELLERGCQAEVVDAFLGHARAGESPFARHSTYDFRLHIVHLDKSLSQLHSELGLTPVPSRVVPHPTRWSVTRKNLLRSAKEQAPISATPQVRTKSQPLENLMRFLSCIDNPHACLLTGRTASSPDENSARTLEALVIDQYRQARIGKSEAAEWLRLIYRELQSHRVLLPTIAMTRLADLTPLEPSPFLPGRVAQARRIGKWQECLWDWVRKISSTNPPPLEWRASVVLSAVIHGGLIDSGKVAFLLQCGAGKDALQVDRGLAHITFELRRQGKGELLHRWFPDPLTEMLMWRMPALPTPCSREMLLRQVSALLKRHGASSSECPRNLSDLLDSARTAWSARVAQIDLRCAIRSVENHSLDPNTWKRLMGSPATAADKPPADLLAAADTNSSADIDDLFAIHPWFGQASETLGEENATGKLASIRGLLTKYQSNKLAVTYLGWAEYLLLGKSSTGRALSHRTVTRLFRAAVAHWLMLYPDDDPAELETGTLTEYYIEILTDLVAEGQDRDVRHALREFHYYLVARHGRQLLENVSAVLGDEVRLRPVDANLVSFDDYAAARDWLDARVFHDWDKDDIQVAKLVLMFGFRLGLRRMEIFGLRLEDVHLVRGMTCLVRPHAGRRLKTKSSQRLVPLDPFLDARERKELKSWIRRRQEELASTPCHDDIAYLLALPERGLAQVNPDVVSDRVYAALRAATGDKLLFMHHLRHSFGTWTYLRLRTPEHPEIATWFAHLPLTAAALRNGARLRKRLLGEISAPTRSYAYVVARLLGHSGPSVSMKSYIHAVDLVLAAQVQREAASISRPVLVAASGLKSATAYAALGQPTGSLRTLVEQVRPRSTRTEFPKFEIGSTRVTGARVKKQSRNWIALSTVRSILSTLSSPHTELANAPVLGVPSERIRDMSENAKFHGSAIGLVNDGVPCPRKLRLPEELDLEKELEPKLMGLAARSPELLREGLEIHLAHLNRHKWDVVFRGPGHLPRLSKYLKFLKALGLENYEYVWTLRMLDKATAQLPSWASGAGKFSSSFAMRVMAPPVASRASSYAKWVGLKLVRRGKPDGPGRALAVLFWLAMVSQGHHQRD